MTEHDHARAFAESVAAYRYPHADAIEAHGAILVGERNGREHWTVAGHDVSFDAFGVEMVCPSTCPERPTGEGVRYADAGP